MIKLLQRHIDTGLGFGFIPVSNVFSHPASPFPTLGIAKIARGAK
jgi:hypothetical protein